MTPAEFRNYAELAGWAVIGLYILARLVRGDREISVRIGGSKRKVKLGDLAERVEKCEAKQLTVDKERRERVPAAAHDWVEKANMEVAEKLQALDKRHDHLAIAITTARKRAEDALAPAEYAEKMIDLMMPVIAWLAWRAGMPLAVSECGFNAGTGQHRRKALSLAEGFRDDVFGIESAPPTLHIVDNHCPFPFEGDGEAFEREVPDHASINSLDQLLSHTRDELVALKRNLRLHPGDGLKGAMLSGNGMGDLIDLLVAAVFADEIPKEPREFSRQFRNALRLAAHTAGESVPPHIEEDWKPKPLTDIEWAEALGKAAEHLGQVGGLRRFDALGVETSWGLGYLSLQRQYEIWFVRPEAPGPRNVIGFEDDGHYVYFEDSKDSQRIRHLRKIVCVGNEGELIRGELVPLECGMEGERITQCRARARYKDWQCQQCQGHDGPHRNANYTWGDPPSMCDHCGKVETKPGELCPACVAYEVEEAKKAAVARDHPRRRAD